MAVDGCYIVKQNHSCTKDLRFQKFQVKFMVVPMAIGIELRFATSQDNWIDKNPVFIDQTHLSFEISPPISSFTNLAFFHSIVFSVFENTTLGKLFIASMIL